MNFDAEFKDDQNIQPEPEFLAHNRTIFQIHKTDLVRLNLAKHGHFGPTRLWLSISVEFLTISARKLWKILRMWTHMAERENYCEEG